LTACGVKAMALQIDASTSAIARLRRQFRYLFARKPWPVELPTVIQFPVNDICDSKCQMCNIWQQKLQTQISAKEASTIFSNRLYANVRAIGLNGGEPTLRRDLADLGVALFETLPALRAISLITNGLNSQRAIQRIDELAAAVAGFGGHLDVMVSLDGVGEIHDLVRGVDGNFSSAVTVLDHLLSRQPEISVRVGCTVIRENVYHLHELLDFCRRRHVYVKFRLGVPNRRLYNLSKAPKTIGKRTWLDMDPFGLDAQQRWHFGQFLLALVDEYEASPSQRLFYRSLYGQLVHGEPRRAGCDWQHRAATITSRGELLYCAVQSDILGDASKKDSSDIYFGNLAHLAEIITDKCATCAHDYTGLPGGKAQARLVASETLDRLGLDSTRLRESWPAWVAARARSRWLEPITISSERRRLRPKARALRPFETRAGALICGWYGTETLGDKAILASIVASLRDTMPGEPITIASLDPACTEMTMAQMPDDLAGCRIVAATSAVELTATFKTIVFGGGPLMGVRPLTLMEAIFINARAHGVPTIVAGCGVGPIGGRGYKSVVRSILEHSSIRIFRDAESKASAENLMRHELDGDRVCEDPAVSWVRSQEAARLRTAPSGSRLALALRDWPSHQYAPGMNYRTAKKIKSRLEASVLEGVELLASNLPELQLVPIPFCTHHAGGDDRIVYWRLARNSSIFRERMDDRFMGRERSPADSLAAISEADALLSMRFHSLVFADAIGLPCVALDYTLGKGKNHALSSRIGCPTFPIDAVSGRGLADAMSTAIASPRRNPAASSFRETFADALSSVLSGTGSPCA
jgi:polysaccharide pyruvyl transferase WcaK-like protein/sulfatase maturation enzyme AslB (radical SAM superfamily)